MTVPKELPLATKDLPAFCQKSHFTSPATTHHPGTPSLTPHAQLSHIFIPDKSSTCTGMTLKTPLSPLEKGDPGLVCAWIPAGAIVLTS